MKIALFHNAPSGGAKRAIYEWVRRLAAHHVIDVYSLTSADHDFCDVRPFVRDHYVRRYDPRPLFDSPLGRLNQWQRWRDLQDLSQLECSIARQIDGGGYDVVFAHTCQYTHAPLVLQFLRTPTVYYLHEPVGPQFSRPIQRSYFRSNPLRERLDRIDPLKHLFLTSLADAQRRSIRSTSRLLANSRYTRSQMKRAYALEMEVCRCGVDHETFRPRSGGEGEKEDSVISVGELTPRKGFDFVVRAVGRLPSTKRPRVKIASNLVNETEKSFVLELAARHDVSLELLTRLSSEELALEYGRALLCVYAPVMEPLGLVPLEAMACEVPVVGVAEGGVIDTVVDGLNGRLVPRDEGAFAEAIQELIDDPVKRSLLGKQAREYVFAEWSWERSTEQIERHLCEAASLAWKKVPNS